MISHGVLHLDTYSLFPAVRWNINKVSNPLIRSTRATPTQILLLPAHPLIKHTLYIVLLIILFTDDFRTTLSADSEHDICAPHDGGHVAPSYTPNHSLAFEHHEYSMRLSQYLGATSRPSQAASAFACTLLHFIPHSNIYTR